MAAIYIISLICHTISKELIIPIILNKVINTILSINYLKSIVSNIAIEILIISYRKYYSRSLFLSKDTTNKEDTNYVAKKIIV